MFRRSSADQDGDLAVQLEAFDRFKSTDDEQQTGPDGIDFSSHVDVFHAIYKQVGIAVPLVVFPVVQVPVPLAVVPVPVPVSGGLVQVSDRPNVLVDERD